tara:strand:+ start:12 stop:785 length:774 start_codon:yes stop_codon:yes gene_type:complete
MGFKLKSGNASSFKNMGSSPAKQMTDFSNVTINGEDAETVKKRNIKEREERKKKKEQEMIDLINNPDQTINKEKFQSLMAKKLPKKKKSPAKGKGDNLKRIMSENKAAQKKAGTWYAPGADPKANKGMPKNFNTKGSSWPDKTPGYESTKMAKDQNFKKKFDARQTSKQKAKDFVKNLKAKGDLVSKKPTSTLGRVANIGKKALKAGGRFAGGIGAASMLYEAYKSGQKHSGGKAVKGQKSFMADAKKNTKSIYKKK